MESPNYICDGSEQLIPAGELPSPLVGAPELKLLRTGGTLIVAYYTDDGSDAQTREPGNIAESGSEHDYAVVRFREYCLHLTPRGEVGRDKHPLTKHIGEGAFEVVPSPWIRQVDPPSGWSKFRRQETHWRHILFALHDDRLELICQIQAVAIHKGPIDLQKLLVEGSI